MRISKQILELLISDSLPYSKIYGGTSDAALLVSDAPTGWVEDRPTSASDIKRRILCGGSRVLGSDKLPFKPYEGNSQTLPSHNYV